MADLHSTLVEFPLVAGEVVRLSPLIQRVTAPNPSVFTGPGTNTYIVGEGDHIAVIDPGPAIPSHIDAILRACDGKIRWILATHTHIDHSPAGRPLADATGAELIGPRNDFNDQYLDTSFKPAMAIAEGAILTSPHFRMRAIETPGHIKNHVSFMLEDEGVLFAGDHIMQGATVVIVAEHGGTMWDYLDSLQKLKGQGIQWLAPAHGHILSHADQVVSELHQHRLAREQKAINALSQLGRATLANLIPLVYPEVGESLAEGVKIALDAHLRKLQHDGLASCDTDAIDPDWDKASWQWGGVS